MSEALAAERRATDERLVVTDRDRQLLEYVARFRLINRDQAMALASFGSLTRANTRLARLVKTKLLSRKTLPVVPGKGSAQALYYLGHASKAILNDFSITQQVRRIARWDTRQVTHVLAANQILVNFLCALKQRPDGSLLTFRTETELRELFVKHDLVPDGWVAWSEAGRRFNAFLEVDLHHEGLIAWRRKLVAYQDYVASGLHQDLFGFKACRVLVLAKSHRRLAHLRTLAQAVGRLCLFATLDDITPENILGSVWVPTLAAEPISLQEA